MYSILSYSQTLPLLFIPLPTFTSHPIFLLICIMFEVGYHWKTESFCLCGGSGTVSSCIQISDLLKNEGHRLQRRAKMGLNFCNLSLSCGSCVFLFTAGSLLLILFGHDSCSCVGFSNTRKCDDSCMGWRLVSLSDFLRKSLYCYLEQYKDSLPYGSGRLKVSSFAH